MKKIRKIHSSCIRKMETIIKIFILAAVFGVLAAGCKLEPTPIPNEPTRYISFTGFDGIDLIGLKFAGQLGSSDDGRIDIATCFGYAALEADVPDDWVLTIPLIDFDLEYWHGSGAYYVYFGLIQPPATTFHKKWVSNEPMLFSDDSPNPTLSLHDAHLILDN